MQSPQGFGRRRPSFNVPRLRRGVYRPAAVSRHRSVPISSNRPVEEWDEVFGDQVVAAAILDRLLHHSHVVTIRGDSYRLREKRRSGLFRPQAGASSLAGVGGLPPPTPAKEA